jgi:hypothetical protein
MAQCKKSQEQLTNHTQNLTSMRIVKQFNWSVRAALLTLSSLATWLAAQAATDTQPSETKGASTPLVSSASASLSSADVAKELQNPVGGLISVPLESRMDFGPASTLRYTLNLQPVIPFEVTPDWLVVSRTILPFVYSQKPAGSPSLDNVGESPVGNGAKVGGIGDLTQSFFLAPKEPMNGWIWGAGPVLRLPTASRSEFGEGRWGAGPTAVLLRQDAAWTWGMLANHIWSCAGWGPRSVSTTYLQPFLAYTTESLTSFGLGTETAYDWTGRQWMVPLDVSVSQLVNVGRMPVDIGLGVRAYAQRPDGGPDWGLKLSITFVFPK